MLLSKRDILELLGKGIIIDPFNINQLKSASYDVRLGDCYYRCTSQTKTGLSIVNPYDPKGIGRNFSECQIGKPAFSELPYFEKHPEWWDGIEAEDKVIIIEPGEQILGHTVEFIGGTLIKDQYACLAEMKARSSVGRHGLEVCRCAGWGDVGYYNRWTMEINNTSRCSIVLVCGSRLAQMKLFKVRDIDPADLYGADGSRDQYQPAIDLLSLRRAWKPSMMLPGALKKD